MPVILVTASAMVNFTVKYHPKRLSPINERNEAYSPKLNAS